jgi:hypothetical protein
MTKTVGETRKSWQMLSAIGLMISIALQISDCAGIGPKTNLRLSGRT